MWSFESSRGKKIDANKFYNSSNKEKNYLMENGPMEQSFMIPDVKKCFLRVYSKNSFLVPHCGKNNL